MNRLHQGIRPVAALILGAALSAAACGDGDSPTTPAPAPPPPAAPAPAPDPGPDLGDVINDYVDLTVIATYADLSMQADRLMEAVEHFAEHPVQEDLDEAAEAWVATREPWEASEGFLFGPVAFLSLDPSLDSWPLDRTQLDQVLASDFELTADFIRDGTGATLRGFHTVEYLLFRDGEPRDAADVTAREIEYLVAVTEVLYEDASLLHEEWTMPGEFSLQGYGDEFKSAGQPGSRYRSQQEAILELIEGMIVIVDEVGNGKIADPHTEMDPAIVESWFSWNSLTDFSNNVRSVQNAYLGGYHKGERGVSLASYVEHHDAALDMRIQSEMDGALSAVRAIPEPFRNNLDAHSEIDAAIDALNTLMETLNTDLKELIRASAS